jgi:hypothetical protein
MIDSSSKEKRPDSADPQVVVRGDPLKDGFEGEGGWTVPKSTEKYSIVLRQWRSQSSRYVFVENDVST